MRRLLFACLLLSPAALRAQDSYPDEPVNRFRFSGGAVIYSDSFWQPVQDRRNRFFTANAVESPGRPKTFNFAGKAELSRDYPSGLSIMGGLEGAIGIDRDSQRVTDSTSQLLSRILLLPLSSARISATTQLYTLGLNAGLGYNFRLSETRRHILKPFVLAGIGRAWFKEDWEISEGIFTIGGRSIDVEFRDQTTYYSLGLGLEWSPHPNIFFQVQHGWRAMNFDSVSRNVRTNTALIADPSEDNATNLKGSFWDFRIGAQF